MVLFFDKLRAEIAKRAQDLAKTECSEGKAEVLNLSSKTKETLGVVDIVIVHGDHGALQPLGAAEAVPTVVCIIWVAVQGDRGTRVLRILVELKDGDWSTTNVRKKFENSWQHANALERAAGIVHSMASLHLLAADKRKPEDRKELKKGLKQCAGLGPNLRGARVALEGLVAELV